MVWETAVLLALSGLAALGWVLILGGYVASTRSIARVRDLLGARETGGCRAVAVVPVRDEAGRVYSLVEGLASASLWPIVVDDESSDSTPLEALRAVAAHGGTYARVLGIPGGWRPKPYLLQKGVEYSGAKGDTTIVFLDADVVFVDDPGRVLGLLCAAARRGVVAGLAPTFICATVDCMAAEAGLDVVAQGVYGFHRVHSRRSRLAWFYGCCWAARASDYWAWGGHTVVSWSLVEDRDLAQYLKHRGLRILVADGKGGIAVIAGSRRDLAMLVARIALQSRPGRARLAAYAGAVAALYYLPLAAPLALAAGDTATAALLGLALTAQLAAHLLAARRQGYPLWAGLLAPLVTGYTLLGGLAAAARGRVVWKKRGYPRS